MREEFKKNPMAFHKDMPKKNVHVKKFANTAAAPPGPPAYCQPLSRILLVVEKEDDMDVNSSFFLKDLVKDGRVVGEDEH